MSTENTIAFVNGEPAACGCKIRLSNGGGEYSDVTYLTLCLLHSGHPAQIEPMDVVRDAEGWWCHPHYLGEPEWEDMEYIPLDKYKAYIAARGIETTFTTMEGDNDEEFERYCETGDADCSRWTPTPPAGDGWFMLSIHDTEDGPVCVWGRKVQGGAA